MKRIIRTTIIVVTLGLMVNCSEQQFTSVPVNTCRDLNNQFGDGSCKPDVDKEGNRVNQLSYSMSACRADILFVVDNSGSMYPEQQELANRFPGFINAISSLEYNIGITTTDISASPSNPADAQNGNGTLWDGKLISFPNGKKFITKNTANAQSQFEQTIQRPETLSCDTGGACPSGDERGIFAATLAVEKAESRGNLGTTNFFRPEAHLAIVILSDENERSDGGNIAGYPLESRDLPETLVQTVKSSFGPSKVFSVHPIIVRSGDSACNDIQNSQQSGVKRPRYGTLYEELVAPNSGLSTLGNIVPGAAGSVCSSNYTPDLQKIGDSINKNVGIVQLACNPSELTVTLGGNQLSGADYEIDNKNRLVLKTDPSCEKLDVSYKCPVSL